MRFYNPSEVETSYDGSLPWETLYRSSKEETWARYLSNPFDPSQLELWWKLALENVSWERKTKTRSSSWFVTNGCKCRYQYSGTVWSPTVWPGWLRKITNYVMEKIGWIENHPNSCNVNLYEDGMDAVGWHCDDEELFQSKTNQAAIISLSLGSTRTFQFKHKRDNSKFEQIKLKNGDILTMEGFFQKNFHHRILRDSTQTRPRINLTWRWIKKHEETCQKAQ